MNKKPIPHRVYNPSKEHPYVTGAVDIIDDVKNKNQQVINAETDNTLDLHQSEINALDSQNYVTVTADDQTTAVTDVLPATGEKDTIYRVGNWDGEQYDPTVYSEYAWDANNNIYKLLDVKQYTLATAEDFIEPDAEKRAKIPTVGAVADIYGYYEENPEFSEVEYDSDLRIVRATKKDGTEFFAAGVDISNAVVFSSSDNPEFAEVWYDRDKRITFALKRDGDVVFGCGVPKVILDMYGRYVENPEFAEVLKDKEGRISEAMRKNGEKYIPMGIKTAYVNLNTAIIKSIEDPEWFDLCIDGKGRIIEGIKRNGNKYFAVPLENDLFVQRIVDNPEWLEVYIDRLGRIGHGIRKNGETFPATSGGSSEEIHEEIEECMRAVEENTEAVHSALEAYASVVSNINAVEEGVERNAQEIDRIKEIEGFSVAEEVENRLESIESDVSELKDAEGIGTDIISLNGGDRTIKDVLYGFKHLAFRSKTQIPSDYAAQTNDCLTLLHFSDIHDWTASAERIKSLFDTYRMIDGVTAIDDAVFTGDICVYTYGLSRNAHNWQTWGIQDVLFGIGNHDIILGCDTWVGFETGAGWGKVPTIELYNNFVAPYVSRWNVIQPEDAATKGKMYYYKDYPTLGFRLLMLDCFDYRKPYRDDGGVLTEIPNTWNYRHEYILDSLDDIGNITDAVVGSLFYVTVVANSTYDTYVVDAVSGNTITAYTPVVWQRDTEYRTEQNEWLADALAGAKALGYHCITTRHETQSVGVSVDCPWNTLDSGGLSMWTQQGADIDNIINEFVAGGGVVACELYGHWHCDRIQNRNGILQITVDCAITHQDYGHNIRVNGDKSQDAMNLVALDKTRGYITLYRIGVDKDMYGRGRHILVYDYMNKKIIYQY